MTRAKRIEDLTEEEIARIAASEVDTGQPYDLGDLDEVPIPEIATALGMSEALVTHMLRVGALPSLGRLDVELFIAEQREVAKALAEMAETTDWDGSGE